MPATGQVVETLSVESAVGLVCKCLGQTNTRHDYLNIAEELLKYQEWVIKCRELKEDDERLTWGNYQEPQTPLKWLEGVMAKLLEVADEQTILAALKVRADEYANITLEEIQVEAQWAIETAIYNIGKLTERLPEEKQEEIEEAFKEALLHQAHENC